MESMEDRAVRMFNAYNAAGPNPGKTYDGRDVPPWEECGPQVQTKWLAAAVESMAAPPVDPKPTQEYREGSEQSATRCLVAAPVADLGTALDTARRIFENRGVISSYGRIDLLETFQSVTPDDPKHPWTFFRFGLATDSVLESVSQA